ncbi:MAG: hypothetical protein F4128_06735 [Gammaproteobacteria bacterium]|nr:hypothetical protein [Gammaproteobacteria bacterium]
MKPTVWTGYRWFPEAIVLGKLIPAGLILLAFGAGYIVALPDSQSGDSERETLLAVEQERDLLKSRIVDLEKTLDLVRRQIQTDRIAYDNLQRSVDESERERKLIQEQIESQRALLERLKKKLNDS